MYLSSPKEPLQMALTVSINYFLSMAEDRNWSAIQAIAATDSGYYWSLLAFAVIFIAIGC